MRYRESPLSTEFRAISVKQDQMTTVKAVQTREDRIRRDFRTVPITSQDLELPTHDQAHKLFLDRRLREELDRYDSVFLNLNPRLSVNGSLDNDLSTRLLRNFTALVPFPEVRASLGLDYTVSTDGAWRWSVEGPERIRLDGPGGSVQSRLPVLHQFNRWAWLGALGVSMLVFWWVRWAAGKIFLLEIGIPPRWHSVTLQPGLNLVVVDSPFAGKSTFLKQNQERIQIIDVALAEKAGNWAPMLDERPFVALDHFDYQMDDEDCTSRKLKLLEELVFYVRNKKTILIVSTIDPLFYWFNEPINALGGWLADRDSHLTRWANALQSFSNATLDTEPPHRRPPTYYRALWSTCNANEKLALFQLAVDGWMNPKNGAAIKQLCARKIVRRDTTVSEFEMEKDFRRFVQSALGRLEVSKWKQVSAGSTWSALRPAVYLIALGFVVVIFYPWFANLGVGWTAGLVGTLPTVPALIRVATEFRKRDGSPAVNT